ncbi:MAG: NUDIX domain-containing protein [Patescibacteria group bacterium]|jgi:isopentenyldiphosphate isomerase
MENKVDIIDEQGNPTGKTADKDTVHRKGLLHRNVHVWAVTPKGEVLMQKRSASCYSYPGYWDISCAGHIDAGENTQTAAMREVQEELGLRIGPKDLEHLLTYHEDIPIGNNGWREVSVSDVYLFQRDITRHDITFPEEEISAIRFIPYTAFVDLLQNNRDSLPPHGQEFDKLLEVLKERFG